MQERSWSSQLVYLRAEKRIYPVRLNVIYDGLVSRHRSSRWGIIVVESLAARRNYPQIILHLVQYLRVFRMQ